MLSDIRIDFKKVSTHRIIIEIKSGGDTLIKQTIDLNPEIFSEEDAEMYAQIMAQIMRTSMLFFRGFSSFFGEDDEE